MEEYDLNVSRRLSNSLYGWMLGLEERGRLKAVSIELVYAVNRTRGATRMDRMGVLAALSLADLLVRQSLPSSSSNNSGADSAAQPPGRGRDARTPWLLSYARAGALDVADLSRNGSISPQLSARLGYAGRYGIKPYRAASELRSDGA